MELKLKHKELQTMYLSYKLNKSLKSFASSSKNVHILYHRANMELIMQL